MIGGWLILIFEVLKLDCIKWCEYLFNYGLVCFIDCLLYNNEL